MLTSETPQAEMEEEISREDPNNPDEIQNGVRIRRAGGDVCPQDDTRLLAFTLDVYCNEDAPRNPKNIKSYPVAPDEDADPCVVYMALEHSAGCPELDLDPVLNVLGACMIFAGVVLMWFGPRARMVFMHIILCVATFIVVMAVAFKLNWLAMLDPTEPDKNKSVFLTFCAILIAIFCPGASPTLDQFPFFTSELR